MKPSVISLFTGAGGLDLGFEAAGFQTRVAGEQDERCCETLRANRRWPVICADLNFVSTEELLSYADLAPGEAAVLIGGPPCQPFSKSGFWAHGDVKRLEDPRAATIETYLRVLAEARPKAFVLENVEGLAYKAKDDVLALIQSRLEDINRAYSTSYKASFALLNAADFGVPQVRRRAFIVGFSNGQQFHFPKPTHAGPETEEGRMRWITSWDALHDLPEPERDAYALRGKWAELLPTVPEGNNYLWHTDRGGGVPLFGWRRRYWSFLLKLAKDAPSWTIQAQPGPATGPFHWSNRRLTMREMARLQTFPDDYVVKGSLADAQRQLGNAVPSLLAEVLAGTIRRQLFGSKVRPLPKLSLSRAEMPPPKASAPLPVPQRYLALRGPHVAHPGKGQGFRAALRIPDDQTL
jgi:DNA (cytosine-5)-methyltransferase 1